MPTSTFRTKRVAELIKIEISRMLIEEFQDPADGIVTVTGVDITGDLRTAKVRFSVYGSDDPSTFLELLEKKKGLIRHSLASRVRLKYNPDLIFVPDETPEYQERIDRLLEKAGKKND